ncbi:MAG: Type III restriction-modification system StyLTI enzyme mod [Candidatus Giovannonibacteria bacterium GW2011_GWB1_43_13]|nr:MAG: Type III restriction-modification system StyLTI enzyme mod [Candidatus Giovannonibacteria bacterium GW2011_GWB1_43_13]
MTEKDLQKEIADLKTQIRKLKKNNLGLVFEDKPEDVVTDCQENIPVLKEVKAKRIVSNDENPNNILIEGDNYHSLSVLNYTHKKKIDLIYIDPPYNTGASVWKYNNDYVDKEDAYRHSKWLSLMRHRLNIAKDLLKDDGFFVCAIDHNELFTLGVLLDKIFGEENRLGIVSVVHQARGRWMDKNFSASNEFMLVYSKTKGTNIRNIVIDPEKKEKFILQDEKGLYYLKNYIVVQGGGGGVTRKDKPNFWYPIYVSKDLKKISLEKKGGYEKVLPITDSGRELTWITIPETFLERFNDGEVEIKREKGKIVIYRKFREQQIIPTHWVDSRYNATSHGTLLLEKILGKNIFDYPKSLYLLVDILKLTTKQDSIVLDFFAGSGTTGHAVLELNKEDGGSRKFILCTNNENNNGNGSGGIAESVCYPRIKNVIKGYKDKKNEKVAGLGGNLSYYQTDLVNIEKIHKIPDEAKIRVTYQAGEMIAVREDTLNEVEKNDWWQIFEGKDKLTAIYFKEDKAKLAELIAKLEKKNLPTALYIFSWGKNEYKGEYSSANIRVEDIPEPIIEVYKELNRL